MNKIKFIFFKIFKKFSELLVKTKIHKKIPFAIRVYSFLLGILWPYKNIIEIQGSKMYVGIDDEHSLIMRATLQNYAISQVHEKETTDLFKRTVKEGNIVVDLGANIGYFTLLAAKLVGKKGKVFSFEPEPKNYSYLKKNIALNGYSQVMASQKAVANKTGKTELYICDYDSGHHTINRYDGIDAYSRGRSTKKHSIEIETTTLDSFLEGKTDHVDVIKMDVEGAEMLALSGMDKTLKINKNLKMFVEFFPLLIEEMGDSPKEFIRKLLEDYKFSIFVIPDDYNARESQMKKNNNIEEIMDFRRKKEDHINLFLER